ncbi:DUF58 domain-containing protein [Natrialba asiatica]|uniref:Uncharacterized protein n=1 Tax=Natrialba asiatica (strain ATCC 700177 / DSM 12278 / JCM 9576 / FERM P-10747 / NBRC 102637 / 172P1) TaxID=29540 RepID=M0AVK5_NATA1|nr:DUF58 domain-containing protein [Natrialba asiatica]ELZ02357.1 hypothetical protein C481_06791 [Natrialba asiatica DSM 12278]
MTVRRLPLLLGFLALGCGLAVATGSLELSLTDSAIGIVALIAVLVGLRSLGRRSSRRERPNSAEAAPERRISVPVPGQSLSSSVADFRQATAEYTTRGRRTIDGLRAAAVAVLTRFEGDTVADATDRIEAGTWTDDPIAAAFLSDSVDRPKRSLRARLQRITDRETAFQRGVRHTAAAIASVGYDRGTAEAGTAGKAESGSDVPSSSPVSGTSSGETSSLPEYDYQRGTTGDSTPTPRRTTTESVDGVQDARTRSTDYWLGIGVVALLAVGIGALVESAGVVLIGVIGIGYAGFARALEPPELELELERTVEDDAPDPGDDVDVTVTLTNTSSGFVSDLRFVDGIPAGLAVTDGSSRLGTALRPGESVSLEYTVTVQRGNHQFDPALAIVRDLSRSTEREYLVGTETTVTCEPELRPTAAPVPLRTTAAAFAGRLTTSEGGTGTTFHSVREYRPNDSLSRIDWNRRAKTGELATLQFHEERAARVVVLVDARRQSYLAPAPDRAHAVDQSVTAAGRIAASLLDAGDTVGLAGLGPTDREQGSSRTGRRRTEPCWLAPASGRDHEIQFQELLATHPQFETLPPDQNSRWFSQFRTIQRRLSAETQIVLLSPLCDPMAADIARRLDAGGHAVTVVSPDPTAERTVGHRLAAVARRVRRFDLEQAGISVVDWGPDESIDAVFARHAAGGSR